MKAEIGFVRDWDREPMGLITDRLRLVITAQSETEGSTLMMFARRMGLTYDECSARLTIEQPATPNKEP